MLLCSTVHRRNLRHSTAPCPELDPDAPCDLMRWPIAALAIALLAPAVSHAQTTPTTAMVAPTDDATRSLARDGGHARDGFDDIEVPSLLDLPFREIVRPSRYVPGSHSMGTTSDGHLDAAARLPLDGVGHFVLAQHRERETHYGTDELVGLLLDASVRLNERHPDTRMGIGNMAVNGGGDIRWSRSHNSGRDADIAFLFHDESGVPIEPDTLLTVGPSLEAWHRDGYYFDVPRNWTLVESLLTSDEADVQWLFIWDPLKRRLLEHARDIGADPDVIARAEAVLHQPGDSAPHDDHFHLRIYCTVEDRLEGCVNIGPVHDHAPEVDEALSARVDELLRGLMAPEPEVAAACIDFIERLEPREVAERVAAALPHQPPEIQIEIMELLADWDRPGVTGPVVPLAESSPDGDVRQTAFWLLGYLADRDAAPGLAGILTRGGDALPDGTSTQLAAVTALRNITHEAAVPALLEAIDTDDVDLRVAATHVLRRTTVTESPYDPSDDLSDDERAVFVAWWQDWYADHGEDGRMAWIERGLAAAGHPISNAASPSQRDLSSLVDAVGHRRDHIRFAADRLLVEHTRGWTPSENWSVERRLAYWRGRID